MRWKEDSMYDKIAFRMQTEQTDRNPWSVLHFTCNNILHCSLSFQWALKNIIFKMWKYVQTLYHVHYSGARGGGHPCSKCFPLLSDVYFTLYYLPVSGPISPVDRWSISDACLLFAKAKHWHGLIARLVAFLLPLEGCALAAAFVVVSIRQCGPSQRHEHARRNFLNQCQSSSLGGEAKYHIFRTVVLYLST